jgi:SAM-dependent methyltransferase
MSQYKIWEQEYRKPRLITNSDEPQLDFKHFVKWLKRKQKVDLVGLKVLDLGSGTGKNSLFLAERGSDVVGIELSNTAVKLAQARAVEKDVPADFRVGDIGQPFPFADDNFDLLLDVVSSNSLSESERNNFINESFRVLKPGGYFFVKALCRDGDKNAQNLIEKSPGKEKDTYKLPGLGLIERTFTQEAFLQTFNKFQILNLERKSSYTQFDGKSYKRFFWVAYLQK